MILTVALCCLVAMMEGVDLQAPGLTVPALGALFHMSPGDKGLFLSMSTFGLMAGAAIGGWLSDRVGRKAVLVVSAGLFGIFTVATAFSTSAEMLMIMRLLTGLGLGGALPNVVALTSETVGAGRKHTAIGILYACMPTGGGAASLLSAVMPSSQWQAVYLLGGIGPLILVPLLIFVLPNRKPAPEAAQARGPLLQALFGGGRAANTLLIWLAFFTSLLIMYILLGWTTTLMLSRGLSHAEASTVQIWFNWVGALGSALTGWLLDRGRRPITTVAAYVLTIAALAYLAVAPGQLAASIFAGAAIGATISGVQAVLYSLAPSCYPTAVRGTGVGCAVAMGRFGSAVGPILAGYLLGAGRSPSQVVMSLVPILLVSAVACVIVSLRAASKSQAPDAPAGELQPAPGA